MTEDYSNFSWEAIQKSLQETVEKVQKQTGASDEEMRVAFAVVMKKFMDVNGFVEPKRGIPGFVGDPRDSAWLDIQRRIHQQAVKQTVDEAAEKAAKDLLDKQIC